MDTVNMFNKMSFYCQPILPLVYDESMSYYETLCKVVGQLNTTGDAVNKLNEGLTGEIADRQSADAALDARIKQIEETNRKIHFLKLDTIGNFLTPGVTRENLSQWIQDGDLIAMLYAPDELENSWAVATNYRCLGATGADSMQLSFYVPISVTNNAGKSGADVAQEVVVISLPVGALTNQWTVRSVTSTIPNTNADGFVNLTATVGDAGAVTCDVEPGAIVEALRNYFSGTNQYAVAVNARLTYDGKQYHSASAIVKADTSGVGNIRITFENYYNGVRAVNGVSQMNTETIFLVGDVSTNAWSVETIDHKTFNFSRYDGFQFTRGENNVITPSFGSTPKEVAEYFGTVKGGVPYQNLPVHLIDNVDNAEYWNGVFDRKSDGRISYTFTASYYRESKMLVRIIELSATPKSGSAFVGGEKWAYAAKEFELPFAIDAELSSTSTNPVQNKAVKAALDGKFDKTGGKIEGNAEITGFLNVGMSAEFSSSINAGSEITSDMLLMAPIVALRDPATEKSISFGVSGENAGKVTSTVSGGGTQYARLAVGTPTGDNDAATKKYVDDHSAGDAITYVDFWPTGTGEKYNGNYDGYQVELATDQTFDAIFDSFNAGNKIVARLYKDADKSELSTSSVDTYVTGDKEFGAIKFQLVNADTVAVAGFPFIAETINMMKLGESALIYLIANRNVLPTPNADGTDNGKVPIINGTKWELKTLPTYANGNEVSY